MTDNFTKLQNNITPNDLNILSDTLSQTSLSTFRLATGKDNKRTKQETLRCEYDSYTKIVAISNHKIFNTTDEISEEVPLRGKAIRVALATISEEDHMNIDVMELDEVHFMCETGAQTLNTSLHSGQIEEKDMSQLLSDPMSLLFLVDGTSQTTNATEPSMKAQAVQVTCEQVNYGINATTSQCHGHSQSDVSMFRIDQKDRLKLELAHNVRFNMDNATWMEEKIYNTGWTQVVSKLDSTSIQCTPIMSNSYTQHTSCFCDQFSQTEFYMKNKSSQACDASVITTNVSCETTYVGKDSASQAVVKSFDKAIDFSDFIEPNNVLIDGPPWSDFDITRYTHLEEITHEEKLSQTSPSVGDMGIQSVPLVASVKIQTIKVKRKTMMNKIVEAKIDLREAEIQAVVSMETKGIGQSDRDDWIKETHHMSLEIHHVELYYFI
uniref:Vitellogenin domain-containing protein n=1 Tax=Heterorhabditis bacteriophora TaxID=37862 RepID=A0A1I7X1T0_HETBA